jgi:hypothetical protein
MEEIEEDGVQLTLDSNNSVRYRAQPGVMTAERLGALRAHKAQIMKILMSRGLGNPAPPRVDDAEDVWLPTMTARMTAMAGERIFSLMRWRRALDPSVCQVALDAMLKRHSILRTRYIRDSSSALWAITEKHRSVPIEYFDLSHLDPQSAATRAFALAPELTSKPFDIYCGPLLRLGLIKLTSDEFVSVFVICHSIFDRLSYPVFFADFNALYHAAASGRPSDLTPLPWQYPEHARRLIARNNGEAGFVDLQYWHQRLLQVRKPVWLAPDRRSPPTLDALVPPCVGQLRGPAMDALRAVTRTTRCTNFVCMALITATALAHLSCGDDAIFWISSAGRATSLEPGGHIGCFMDFAPLVIPVSKDATFRQACDRTRRLYEEALPHFGSHPTQLDPLFRKLRRRGPLSQPVLNYHNTPMELPTVGRYLAPHHAISLMFDFFDMGDSLDWVIQYKGVEYEDATIESVSRLIANLLEVAARNPDERLSALLAQMEYNT